MHPAWVVDLAKLALLSVLGLLMLATCVRAQQQSIRTPESCERLAKQHGFIALPTYTRAEAEMALKHLGIRYIAVADARACRAALRQELAK